MQAKKRRFGAAAGSSQSTPGQGRAEGTVAQPNRLFVAADPDFHSVIPSTGAVFYDGAPGSGYRPVTIDTRRLPNGPHRLHIRSEAAFSGANASGTGSGILVLPFSVQNP